MSDITILNPDGVEGTIPSEHLSEAINAGYSLPGPHKITAADFTEDGKEANVINSDGISGTIPIENLQPALSSGFKLASSTTPEKVKSDQELINKNLAGFDEIDNNLNPINGDFIKSHENDKVFDKDNNLQLKTNNGEILSLPIKQAIPLLANKQVKMADDNFQSLYEAAVTKAQALPNAFNQGQHGVVGALRSIPGAAQLEDFEISHSPINNVVLAANLANRTLSPQFNTAETIGGVAGTVAQVLGTGGAGLLGEGTAAAKVAAATKGLIAGSEAGIARRVAAQVIGEAAGGATIASPQALAQLTLDKDPQGAAETLAWGSLVGGGLGTLMSGAEEGSKAVINSLNAAKKYSGEFGHMADTILSEQLGMNATDRLRLGSTPQEQSEKLGTLIEGVGGEEAIKKMSRKQFAQSVLDMADESGPKIGATIKNLDKIVEDDKLHELLPNINNINKRLEEIKSNLSEGPLSAPLHKILDDSMKEVDLASRSVEEGADQITFDRMQKLKKTFQDETNYRTDTSGSANTLRKQIAAIVRTEFEDAADKVAVATGNAKLIEDWTKQKQLYAISSQLEKPLNRVLNAPEATKLMSVFGHGGFSGGAAGATIGSAFGPHGAAIGGVVGAIGNKLFKHWMKDEGLTKIGLFLRKNAQNPNIGTYIALDSAAILKQKLNQIAPTLRMTTNKIVNIDAIKNALGSDANGLSKKQQFEKLSSQINNAMANPQVLDDQIKHLTAPIKYHHPEIGQGMDNALRAKIQFLHDNLPKQMSAPQPFSKNEKWEPSKQQIEEFNKIMTVAENPFHIIDQIKAGTVTSKQVAALSVMNPAILANIREELMKEAYSGKTNLNYQQRLSASLVMGQNMNAELDKVTQLQSVYSTTQQPISPPPSKAKKGTASHLSDKMPGAQYTQAQRLLK
jgi:hypothetical protein